VLADQVFQRHRTDLRGASHRTTAGFHLMTVLSTHRRSDQRLYS
jgi:hypothetical protein